MWIGHPEDVRAWEALYRVHADHDRLAGEADPASREAAYRSLLAAEGSDYTWWYGEDHASDQDAEFDRLYRTHLGNVYRFLGREPPAFLERPIAGPGAVEPGGDAPPTMRRAREPGPPEAP